MKKDRLKQRSEPWITREILELIKERDKFLLDFKRSNLKNSSEQFCKIRNLIQNKVKKVQNSFYNDKVKECKGSSSQLWKTLKSISLSKGTPGSLVFLKEKKLYLKILKLLIFLPIFLL